MEQLRKDGWYINESQTAELFPEGVLPKTSNEIFKTILDEDLRTFGEPSIINLHRKDDNVFEGPCVLQLLRYRNVSVPRIKEELNQADPVNSIIRLFFTDGHTSISAMVLDNIGINADTPPGTKILFSGKIQTEGIFLMLTKKDVKVLGGKVGPMIEKWQLEKNSVRSEGYSAKSAAMKGTGAPKWVSFTKRNEKNIKLDKAFRANDAMPKNVKEGEEEDEFMKNREQVLKEVSQETTKTFVKPNVERPPPKEKVVPVPKEPKEPKPRKEFKRRGRKNSEDGPDVDVGEYANHRPSGPATLFDFIGGSSGKDDVAKMVEETARVQVSGESRRDGKSFGRGEARNYEGRGGGRGERRDDHGRGRGSGAPDTRRQGNDRGAGRGQGPIGGDGNQKFENPRNPRNQGGPNTGSHGQQFNRNDRPNTGPHGKSNQHQQQNDRNAQGSGRFNQQHQQTPGHGNNKPNFQRNNAPQEPQGRSNQKFGNQDRNQSQQGNPQSFQRNAQNAPQEHQGRQRGNFGNQDRNQSQHQNFQRDVQNAPRGNPRNDRGPPRGNTNPGFQQPNRQSTSGPVLNRHDFPPVQSAPLHPYWRPGSQCLSTWTDGNLYPATVTAVLPDGQCVVRYNEYGNTQTIPADFLIIP